MRAALPALALAVALVGCGGARPSVDDAPPFDLAMIENDGTTGRAVCLDLASGTRTVLTPGDSSVFGPRWVPSLGRLVVASTAARPVRLIALDPATGAASPLWPNPADDEVPDWAPSGDAVYSLPTDTGRALVLADADGRTRRRLTDGTHTDKQPVVSPDGRRVAFVSDRSGTDAVWVLDLATAALAHVAPGDAPEGHPAWYPDGDRLVAYRYADGDADLFALGLDGSATPLTSAPGNDLVGRVAPDGRWLAFGSARSGDWEVYLARADGADLRRLTDREGFDGDPVWLPDGRCPS